MNLLRRARHSFNKVTLFNKNGNDFPHPEDLHELLLDNLPSPVTYVQKNYHYKYVNKACADWYGLKAEEIIGKPVKDFFNTETYNHIKQYMDKAMKGERVHFESEVGLKNGKRFVEITYTPDFDKNGKVKGYVALVNDITEKKEIENAISKQIETEKQAQKDLNKIIKEISDYKYALDESCIVAITDQKGIIQYVNDNFCKISKYSSGELLGQDHRIINSGYHTKEYIRNLWVTIASGKIWKGELKNKAKDGTYYWVDTTIVPFLNEQGKPYQYVAIRADITGRKLAEENITKLAAIVQSSGDAIISKTLDGIITSWNDAAEKMFGYSAEEMIGKPITKLLLPHHTDEMPNILDQSNKEDTTEHFETQRITKDQRILDISLTISLVKDIHGNVTGTSRIARDITAQKKMREALRESEERLRLAAASTQLGTWEFHPLTKKLIWSKECKMIYGFTEDTEPDSQLVADHNHPDDKEYIHQEVVKAMDPDNENNFQMHYRIFRKNDKQVRWLKVNGKVFFNSNKQPERFIGTMLDITEEKLAEQLIHESEERLRMAIESTKLGTWEYHPLSGLLTWSDECKKIYDVPADMKVDYKFFSDHIYPEDVDYVQQTIQKAMDPAGNGHYDIQYRIVRYSDRQPRWIRAQGKVFFNPAGHAERFIGTVLDITEEKTQEQKLKDSVDLFTAMADNVPVMIWMSGEDKFNDFFNKTWLQFTGRSIEKESNERWLENVHPDDVQSCIDNYNRAFTEQKGFYTEYRLKRYDGKYRWIADNSVPRYKADGSFAGFISACLDIDEQQRFREKIMENELLLKTISNAAPVGLWMADSNGQNTFLNDTWIEWTGIPYQKQLGSGWLDKVIEEDKVNAPAKFIECALKREKYSSEFRILRKDGELRWCLTEGSPYYDINGEFAGYAGSVTDITDLKKLEERKDDFIKMASHELKTPITSIKGYVQLLLNIYDELNEEKIFASKPIVKSSLNTISKQVSKLTRLISELLDLSRIESGKLELYRSEFDLGALVEETVQDVRHITNRHAIIVNNDIKKTIYGDKDRIAQVLLNLLTNAIKYSPQADNIEVFVEETNTHSIIKIKDHGIGIDKKDHSRIFDRFYRVEGKSEQTYPGFGIGLFIAGEIVQRHGGTISVDSEKDKGSVFIVSLPFDGKREMVINN
ncbi:MAG: PAS domain S-box protein [Bacteroidota bacterium]